MSVVSRAFVAITVFISILVFALPTGALASGFESVSEKYLAIKKKQKSRGELSQIAVQDSDDELLAEEAEAEPQKSVNNSDSSSAKSDCCPTCGRTNAK